MTNKELWAISLAFTDKMFHEIKHGDAEHQLWLQRKCQQLTSELYTKLKTLLAPPSFDSSCSYDNE